MEIDTRPHEQRRTSPRKARRLNHPFQHLYRHDSDIRYDSSEDTPTDNCNTTEYLIEYGGYSPIELQTFSQTFPPLLELSVSRHLKPKLRFLKYTLNGASSKNLNDTSPITLSNIGKSIPPSFYGARLEHAIAPRHAFLTYISKSSQFYDASIHKNPYSSLPQIPSAPVQLFVLYGIQLLKNPEKMQDFLFSAGRSSRQFAALCNRWNGSGDRTTKMKFTNNEKASETRTNTNTNSRVTSQQIDEFSQLFRRGLLSAARNEWKSDFISPSQMIPLLVTHGANVMERDTRGVSLLHWAAGSGNLKAYQILEYFMLSSDNLHKISKNEVKDGILRVERDGASTLHWAAAGAGPKEFGIGGHLHLCTHIIQTYSKEKYKKSALIDAVTKDGNSVLMWASWAGSLDIVKLLISNEADLSKSNRNGCTIAHWAASGGNLEICKYLHGECNVPFIGVDNHAGNTPLSHAVAYGRVKVVRWLKDLGAVEQEGLNAQDLAKDFVEWTKAQNIDGGMGGNNNDTSNESENRKAVLDILLS